MAYIVWDNSFVIEVGFIDRQHKKLVSIVNELHDAMQKEKEKFVLEKILSELVDYTVEHFATEERVFDQIQYPESEQHKKEHADLVSKVAKFKTDFESGKNNISNELFSFLKSWLIDHIKGSDLKYAEYFRDNGVF